MRKSGTWSLLITLNNDLTRTLTQIGTITEDIVKISHQCQLVTSLEKERQLAAAVGAGSDRARTHITTGKKLLDRLKGLQTGTGVGTNAGASRCFRRFSH